MRELHVSMPAAATEPHGIAGELQPMGTGRAGLKPYASADLWLLGLIVATMPLAWCYLGNAINLPLLLYVGIAFVVIVTMASSTLLRTAAEFTYPRPLLIGLGLYLAFFTLSRLISQVPETSAVHWWLRFSFIVGALACLALGRQPWRRVHVRVALAISSVACAVWGIVEFVDSPRRTAGPFMDANNFALVCAVGVLLLLPNLVRTGAPALARLALWCGLTLLSLGIVFAYSRAISLLWLFGTLAFIVLAWRVRAARGNLGIYVVLAFACYVLSVALLPETSARVTGGGDLATTLSVRRAMLDSALAMWRDYPLLGAGIGTFRMLYPGYRGLGDQVTAGNTPHNDYVLALSEGGPLLLAFYLVLLGAIAWRGLQAARSLLAREAGPDRNVDSALAISAIAIACGSIMVHALVNFVAITLSLQFLFGCLVGLLFSFGVSPRVALAANEGDVDRPGEEPALAPRMRLLLGAAVLALVLVPLRILAQDAVAYAVILGQQGIPFAETIRSNGKHYLAFLAWIDRHGPRRGLPSYGAATYYEKLASRASGEARIQFGLLAQESYANAIERLPVNHRAYLAWAQLSTEPWQRDLDKAATLARISSSIDPTDAQVYQTRVHIELLRDRPEAAYLILRDEFFPWSYYGASTRALVAQELLLQLRRWSLQYGKGPPTELIDARLYRAQRVIQAVQFERALGLRE